MKLVELGSDRIGFLARFDFKLISSKIGVNQIEGL